MPVQSPQQAINMLNYSIVTSDEEDNPLVVKLRISENESISSNKNSKVPVVVITRLKEDQFVASPRRGSRTRNQKTEFTTKKREKSEPVEEEMGLASPRKIQRTPQKNHCAKDDNMEDLCTAIITSVIVTTPVKRSLNDTLEIEISSPGNRRSAYSTPRRGRFSVMGSPMDQDKSENPSLRKREVKTPSRYRDDSPVKAVKVNLDESFRRSVLRCRLNTDYGKGTKNKQLDSEPSTPKLRTRTRKSFAQFYYDTDTDIDDIQIVEALKQSEKEVNTNKRVLRSRSSSLTSENSQANISEDDVPISKRVVRQRRNITPLEKSPEKIEKSSKTPRTPRGRRQTPSTPKSNCTPKTPKNRLKLLRDGVITPSMHSRSSIVQGDNTPLMKARSQLHVSYIPDSLPCREKEYLDVYNFLRGKLDDGCGGCMYISGVPGTGKTATVTSVIGSLQQDKEICEFNFVSINGMRLTEPRQAYVEIWKQLGGKTVPWEQAQSLLEERFTKKKNMCPVVMLIDELDILCTKRQDVVYNLLDWPTKSKDQLIVVTIANTMDLPERLLMSRVTSRLGLTRLTFQAYTHKQLMEIVTKRLTGTDSFNSDAVQLVARKVASVSGDARRALDICRRAAEMAEEEGKGQLVTIAHINQALNAMITQPQVLAIKRCSRLQKLILQAIVAEIERTGVEECTFIDIFKMLVSCCALDGFKMVTSTVAQRAVSELSACRLIITDQKCSDIYQRIILNVSVHDVYFALKKD